LKLRETIFGAAPLAATGDCHSVTRSIVIFTLTAIAVAVLYYAFSTSPQLKPESVVRANNSPTTASVPGAAAPASQKTGAGSAQPPLPASTEHASDPTTAVAAGGKRQPDESSSAFVLSIRKDQRQGLPDVLRVQKGDPVTLTISSDRAGTLEIHGYQQKVKLEPGATATLSFVANKTGRYSLDLHARDGAHVEVTALEVRPK
jgi:heme/copper-type cytochrome/quinol oxidase subunit 2